LRAWETLAYCLQSTAKRPIVGTSEWTRGDDVGTETYARPTSTGTATPSVPTARSANGAANGTVPGAAPRPTGTPRWIAQAAGRRPRVEPPEPRLRQLIGVCGWAAVLGGIGLVIGIRGLFGVLAGDPPSWYEPAAIVAGGLGIALTIGAFLTVHRTKAPWIMLLASSVSLATTMVMTSVAF
jgi:hypothetical protein